MKRSLVEPNQITSKYQHCVLIDGTVKKVEVFNIYVDTPFYKGRLEVLCMERPIYDLIIGNISGVKDSFVETTITLPDNDMTKQTEHSKDDQGNKKATVDITQGVQTRAQKEKEKGKVKPLKVVNPIAEISLVEIKEAQNGDETLSVPKKMAEKGEKKVSKNGSTHWYVEEKGILYRKFQSEHVEQGKLFKQLMVSIGYRQHVLRLGHDSILSWH